MKSIFRILVFSLSLLHFNTFGLGSTVSYEEIFEENDIGRDKAELSCTCNGRTKTDNLTMNEMEEVFLSILRRRFCQKNEDCRGSGNIFGRYNGCGQQEQEICDMFNQCHNCFAVMEQCEKNAMEGNTKHVCHKRKIFVTDLQSKFDYKWNTANDSSGHLSRSAREVGTCPYPKVLQTSEIDCTIYPSLTKCMQKCQFGYTLKEGIKRQMSCSHAEDVWKPVGFEECQPFLDCSLKLIGPGKLKCGSSTAMDPPICEVTCFSNGEKQGTPTRSYTCRISGNWGKKLPFCASSKSVLNLVPAPRIKLHSKHNFLPWEASVKTHKKVLSPEAKKLYTYK